MRYISINPDWEAVIWYSLAEVIFAFPAHSREIQHLKLGEELVTKNYYSIFAVL